MKCKECNEHIVNNECRCSRWQIYDKAPTFLQLCEQCMKGYDFLLEQNQVNDPIGGNHTNGVSLVLFKGDFYKCQKVKEYIRSLKVEEKE